MNLEDLMLCEIGQAQKEKIPMISSYIESEIGEFYQRLGCGRGRK